MKGFRKQVLRGCLLIALSFVLYFFQIRIVHSPQYDYYIDAGRSDLSARKNFLAGKRDFLLRLLDNPNLIEHETFTELLWSVFHLREELEARDEVGQLSALDSEHLAGDIKRVYVILLLEWLAHMRHLQREYPYLFSLAVRTNPFDADASAQMQ